jgi:uncharacterized short protein YbdD (DUF466 family)
VKTIFNTGLTRRSFEKTGAAPADAAPGTRVSGMTRAVRQAYLQIFGIPDYERYTEHMALRHAGAPVLSRREFCAQAIDRKYGCNGPRCC